MSGIFGGEYAGVYDALYGDKDYIAEGALLGMLFEEYGSKRVQRVLDLGCGSGNHLVALKDAGYRVAGVDRSPEMLAQARKKIDAPLFCRDIRECDLGERFDAVIMMFAVLGYQIENADVLAALRTARRHLEPGGLFVFDCWYGPAVLLEKPSDRTKEIRMAGADLRRSATSSLDVRSQTCVITFRLERQDGSRPPLTENHRVRFFFPKEIEFFLQSAGFRLIRLGGFPHFHHEPAERDWNVMALAEAL